MPVTLPKRSTKPEVPPFLNFSDATLMAGMGAPHPSVTELLEQRQLMHLLQSSNWEGHRGHPVDWLIQGGAPVQKREVGANKSNFTMVYRS